MQRTHGCTVSSYQRNDMWVWDIISKPQPPQRALQPTKNFTHDSPENKTLSKVPVRRNVHTYISCVVHIVGKFISEGRYFAESRSSVIP